MSPVVPTGDRWWPEQLRGPMGACVQAAAAASSLHISASDYLGTWNTTGCQLESPSLLLAAPHMLGWKHEISGSDKRTYSVDTDECKEYSAVCVSGWQCLDNAVFNLYLLVEETIIIKWKMKTRVIMIVTTE